MQSKKEEGDQNPPKPTFNPNSHETTPTSNDLKAETVHSNKKASINQPDQPSQASQSKKEEIQKPPKPNLNSHSQQRAPTSIESDNLKAETNLFE